MKLSDRFKAFRNPEAFVESVNKANGLDLGIKSSQISEYVREMLYGKSGANVSPTYAFWMYDNSDTISDAVDRISWAFAGIEPALKDKNTGEFLTKSSDHPLLALLNAPGLNYNGGQLKFELMVSFLVTGNCFPIARGNTKYEPVGLDTISANKVSLTPDVNNKLLNIQFTNNEDNNIYTRQVVPKRTQYVYQADNGLSETRQVLIKKATSGVQARCPITPVYYQALTKYYGNQHNTGLLQNGSRPSGLFTPAKEGISQQNYEKFVAEVNKMTGAIHAGSNIVAPVAVNYQNLLLNPRDMDFIKLIENSREEIYNIYNIPMPLVATGTMTNSNYQNAITSFYDLAVLPRARFLLESLGEFLLPRYKDGDRYELTFDEKALPALKQRMFERAETMRKVYAFSEDEIRSTTGYESTGEEGKEIYKPANLIPSGADDDYTDDNINPPANEE